MLMLHVGSTKAHHLLIQINPYCVDLTPHCTYFALVFYPCAPKQDPSPLAGRELLLEAPSPHSRVSPPRPHTGPRCHVGPVALGSHEKCDLGRPVHNTGTRACCCSLGNTWLVKLWHAMSNFQCRGQEPLHCVSPVPRHPPRLHHDFTARPWAVCSYSGI